MEDQPVEVVSDVGQDRFRFGTRDTDCGDEQPEVVLLMREDMLDRGADGGLRRVRPRDVLRHRLAGRLAAMDPARSIDFDVVIIALRQPTFVDTSSTCQDLSRRFVTKLSSTSPS
jgi:hypothetical protein